MPYTEKGDVTKPCGPGEQITGGLPVLLPCVGSDGFFDEAIAAVLTVDRVADGREMLIVVSDAGVLVGGIRVTVTLVLTDASVTEVTDRVAVTVTVTVVVVVPVVVVVVVARVKPAGNWKLSCHWFPSSSAELV